MASKAKKGTRRLIVNFANQEDWDYFCSRLVKHGIIPPPDTPRKGFEFDWDKHKKEMWDLVEWEMQEKAKKYGLYLPPIAPIFGDRKALKARELVEEEIARRESEDGTQPSTSERIERSK